jgi:hypothetical protein
VTAPSQIYDPSRFDGVKTLDYPAFSMTQYAAKQYTKWLSLIAETPFRLPMESEWMHAASAGVQQSRGPRIPLEAYANFDQHRDSVIPVGQLRPNSWGLYDMQGNVMEWVITKLAPRRSAIALDSSIDSSVDFGEKGIEQWIAKGGHFASTAEDCEISRRTKASLELWEEDPMLPHSTHWLCNFGESSRIGFRIVRSYGDLQKEKMQRYWEPVSEGYARRVAISLSSGYSVQGVVTPELPDQIREAGIPQPQDWNIPR